MDFNNKEEKFLNLLGIMYDKNENCFVTEKEETYVLDRIDQYSSSKIPVTYIYKETNGDGIIKISVGESKREINVDKKGLIFGIEEFPQKNGTMSTSLNLYEYTIDQEEKYRIHGDWYIIDVIPEFPDIDDEDNQKQFVTCLKRIGKDPNYIIGGLSSFIAENANKEKGFYDLNWEFYEMLLTKRVNSVYKYDIVAIKFFTLMLPVFHLIYNDFDKYQQSHLNDFLEKLANERERINQEADDEIARINSRRNALLRLNNERQQELLNNSKKEKKVYRLKRNNG